MAETDAPGLPVIVRIVRRPKPGKADELARVIDELTHEGLKFPGHLGVVMYPPASVKNPDFRVSIQFRTMEDLRRWEASPVRAELVRLADDLSEGSPAYEVCQGLDAWFLPPRARAFVPPPIWKMAVVTQLAIYPQVVFFTYLTPHIPIVGTASMPTQLFFSVGVIVILTAWWVLPGLTKLFQGWLYPSGAAGTAGKRDVIIEVRES